MNLSKINIEKDCFDINLKFYFILKFLVRASLNSNEIHNILIYYSLDNKITLKDILSRKLDTILNIKTKSGLKKYNIISDILDLIDNDVDIKLFIFSLKLIMIKSLLLEEAKVRDLLDITKLESLEPLSLAYDQVTLFTPYSTRVSGALLSLLFFDKLEKQDNVFISNDTTGFLKQLSKEVQFLIKNKVEPNQIFMLMFNESINQSIISDSGSNYEDRILSILKKIGIDEKTITKTHDKADSSTEFDFFFELESKTYGISAKRTLRERYKQFIKTAQMSKVDVMIEITLGVDLTEEKMVAIREHSVCLFVADEIYQSKVFLQNKEGVYSVKSLNLTTLKELSVLGNN
ncbi:MAG: hypothetical protein M0O97_04270 [Arcobacteraceae bacterium]|nr:hypothetical protein [Arcobacteraceae bacterium]